MCQSVILLVIVVTRSFGNCLIVTNLRSSDHVTEVNDQAKIKGRVGVAMPPPTYYWKLYLRISPTTFPWIVTFFTKIGLMVELAGSSLILVASL